MRTVIEVLAPTTLADRSFLEHIRFEHDSNAPNQILFKGLVGGPDAKILKQAKLAREHVCTELVQPWLSFLVRRDLREGQITISFREEAERGESSFGLAFVVGILALSLDVPVLGNQAFTGEIHVESPPTGANAPNEPPENPIQLRQVQGFLKKTLACALDGCPALLFPFQQEDPEINRAEIDNASRPPSERCELVPLGDRLRVANLINFGLDIDSLWRRADADPLALAFGIQLLDATAMGGHGGEFPRGVGYCMSSLRRATAFPPEIEAAIRGRLPIWRKYCPQEHQKDLLKAVISTDPQRQLDVGGVPDISNQLETDISHWLKYAQNLKPQDLLTVFPVLELIREVAVDLDVYRPLILAITSKSVSVLEQATHYARKSNTLDPIKYVLAMASQFLESFLQIDPNHLHSLIPTLNEVRHFVSAFNPMDAEERESLLQAVDSLLSGIKTAQVAALDGLPVTVPATRLKVEFAVCEATTRSWRFPRINDLVARYVVEGKVLCELPSPVLLFDSVSQCSNFSRRRSFAIADDAMNRLPLEAMRLLKNAWHSDMHEIGFCLEDGQAAEILWVPLLSPWPPAIDSQLFAACIARNRSKCEPASIMDVGCGTGFLASVCLKAWPSIARLVLVEPIPSSLRLAVANITPQRREGQTIDFRAGRFDQIGDVDRVDLIVSAPPYLPERPGVPRGIEMATNGTALLEALVARGAECADEVWLTFSVLAWPEFIRTLLRHADAYRLVEILDRSFVPFRIPWLEPRTKDEGGGDVYFAERVQYYENVLLKRGLIDLDSDDSIHQAANYLAAHNPERFVSNSVRMTQDPHQERHLDETLSLLRTTDSHGYRFWHEVRVVRLVAANKSK